MIFRLTTISGCFVIDLEKRTDKRGFLARSWDKAEFAAHGIHLELLQGYVCSTLKKGTLRGPHYTLLPIQDIKLTRVTRGRLFEVVLDLRPESTSYKKWQGFKFSSEDYKMLVTPPGCAHAVLILEDNTEYISYYSAPYDPVYERGIRFDDPAFGIDWPIPVTTISEKDKSWPNFKAKL